MTYRALEFLPKMKYLDSQFILLESVLPVHGCMAKFFTPIVSPYVAVCTLCTGVVERLLCSS